jgi:transcriptional regulator with XRE-family HTH domain
MRNLRRLRGLKGLTQEQVSKLTNIPRTRLVYFESDKCHCLSDIAEKKLCAFYNVNKFELYGIDILRYLPETTEELQYVIDVLVKGNDLWD